MADGVLLLSWNNHKTTFCDRLSKLRKEGCYTDVTLSSEGRFYPLHKLVLSTCSEYFEKLFENTTCKNPVIVFNDIKSRELDALVQYMYAGEVSVPQNNLPLLIKAAEVLQIKGLAVPDTPPSSTKNKADHSSNVDSPQRKRQRAEEVPVNVNAPSSGYRPTSADDRLSASSRWKRDNQVPSQQTVSPITKPRNEPQEARTEELSSLQNVFGVSEIKVEAAADDGEDNSSHGGSIQPVDLEATPMTFKSEASEDSLPLQTSAEYSTQQYDPSEKDMNPGPSDVLDWQDGIIDSDGGTIDPNSELAMLATHSQSMIPQNMQMMPGAGLTSMPQRLGTLAGNHSSPNNDTSRGGTRKLYTMRRIQMMNNPNRLRTDLDHSRQAMPTRKRCCLCALKDIRKDTKFQCSYCQIPLCRSCSDVYHQADLTW